jgi:hypothetical protein
VGAEEGVAELGTVGTDGGAAGLIIVGALLGAMLGALLGATLGATLGAARQAAAIASGGGVGAALVPGVGSSGDAGYGTRSADAPSDGSTAGGTYRGDGAAPVGGAIDGSTPGVAPEGTGTGSHDTRGEGSGTGNDDTPGEGGHSGSGGTGLIVVADRRNTT